MRFLYFLLIFGVLTLAQCRCSDDSSADREQSEELPKWIPIAGLPVPGHPQRSDSDMSEWQARPLTLGELITVARTFHPTLSPFDYKDEDAFQEAFWSSPEQQNLYVIQQAGFQRRPYWLSLVRAVNEALPSGYKALDHTVPTYFPTYRMVVTAPRQPGATVVSSLVVYLSTLVPYYIYYQRDSNIEDPLADRSPEMYQVTEVHNPSLRVVVREIEQRYGYWLMDQETAMTFVPGIHVNGLDIEKTPTLMDALFTSQLW